MNKKQYQMKLIDDLVVMVDDDDYVKELYLDDKKSYILNENKRVTWIKYNTLKEGIESGRLTISYKPGSNFGFGNSKYSPTKLRRREYQKGNNVYCMKNKQVGVVERRVSTGYYIVRFDDDCLKYCYINDLLCKRG